LRRTLGNAIDKLHAEKLVFGDLRPPNIIVHNSSVHLVDFDWAGRVGEARYPSTINMDPGIFPDGVDRGGLIKMEHDRKMLQSI
ncbi:hypothetical protein B0H11DRAFT_1636574, partial [Mycena galericulata]